MLDLKISVEGLDDLIKTNDQIPEELEAATKAAGREGMDEILKTRGIKEYPAAPPGSQPPPPYYKRGVGYQSASGANYGNSEKYGTSWTVEQTTHKTTAVNAASYADKLAGNESNKQPAHIKRVGWRTWLDVANEKRALLEKQLDAWVQRALDKFVK